MQSAAASVTDQLAVKHSQTASLVRPFLCRPHMGHPLFYGQAGAEQAEEGYLGFLAAVSQLATCPLIPFYKECHCNTIRVDGQDVETGSHTSVLQHSSSVRGHQEGESLLSEGDRFRLSGDLGRPVVRLHDRENWFYFAFFLVPKKTGGFRPILDLHKQVHCPQIAGTASVG